MVQANRFRVAAPAWLCACMAGLLAGCSSNSASLNPVDWWRGLQGGKIAEERPAPPGADDPSPNLGSIPERPTPTDPKFREQLANALIADRANAQHVAGPAADPSSPAAAPSLFGRGTLPPPGKAPPEPAQPAAAPSAPPAAPTSQEAAPPPTGVSRAPVGAVQSSPLPDRGAEPDTAQQAAALPALPSAPPPSANLPGAPASAPVRPSAPAAAEVAASAVPAPAASTSAPAATASVEPVSVAFGPGSATLPRGITPALRQLAAKRGNAAIAVTGYGDATSREPSAQSAALSLGLARGQAIANALVAAGVPANIIRIDAEASGRGGTARLVE